MPVSTLLRPLADDHGYKSIPVGSLPGNPCGILLPNSKADWVSNILFFRPDIAVYWSNKGIAGIRTSSKTVVDIGTPIAVKESETEYTLYGVVKDIILPATDVVGLVSLYNNEELGVMGNAQTIISQALDVSPTATGVVGYEIDLTPIEMQFDPAFADFVKKVEKIDNIPQHGRYVY